MKTEKSRTDLLQEFEVAPPSTLFSQVVVAAVRDCSLATLERDRWAGGGIPYRKIGRAVRYVKSDILTWIAKHVPVLSTSAAG